MKHAAFPLRLACVALFAAILAPPARAAALLVPAQYATIGAAVTAAAAGDTVLIADGTYSGAGNFNIDFNGKDLIVQSASGAPANCVIDCQSQGRAFLLQSGETANSRISGLTIKNGASNNGNGGGIYITTDAPAVTNCVFSGNSANVTGNGGGLFGGAASNCIFTGNLASLGGGMADGSAKDCVFTDNISGGSGGGLSLSKAEAVTNCVFTHNRAYFGAGIFFNYGGSATNCAFSGNTAYDGGGIYYYNGGLATNCVFTNNVARNNGGGGVFFSSGGAAVNCVFTANTAPNGKGGGMSGGRATGCAFNSNTATYFGGGVFHGTLTNCAFTGNSSGEGGGMYISAATGCVFTGNSASYGGGGSSSNVVNCVFTNNSTLFDGGGLYQGTASNCVFFGNKATQYSSGGTIPKLGNGGGTFDTYLYFCTLVSNSAQGSGGGAYFDNAGSIAINCIVWGNVTGKGAAFGPGSGSFTSSDVQGGYVGVGNINSNPLFVSQAAGNLHLTVASPCVNAGAAPVSPGSSLPATDCDGGKRLIGAKPDMGAYEFGNVGVFGEVAFEGIFPAAPAQNVVLQFRPAAGGAAVSQTYFTTADGAFYLYGVPDGSYNLWIKSPKYLSAVVPVTVAGGSASLTAKLLAGDSNNDNSVDNADFGLLIGAYGGDITLPGSGYDATADFNGDGSVDSTDFGLLIENFNLTGTP